MRLAGATRAADAAIWQKSAALPYRGGLRRAPPVLAVEVAGPDEGEPEGVLREKARWYLAVGVALVWIVLPQSREVIVISSTGEVRLGRDDVLAADPLLPGLTTQVADLFRQIEER